jgi:hypothetical protein
MASLIDLGQVRYCGSTPEVEDHSFNLQNIRSKGILQKEQFWHLLQSVAKRSMIEIFGSALQQVNRSCVVDARKGNASLGCLLPAVAPRLFINHYGKLRIAISDGNFDPIVSVTDIRLYEDDHTTPKEDLIEQVNKLMQDGHPVILSVGLIRPFRPHDDSVEQHWLQVNNIHVKGLILLWRNIPMKAIDFYVSKHETV